MKRIIPFRTAALKRAAVWRTLLRLAAIPVGVFTARYLADATTGALAGDTAAVLRSAWQLAVLLIGWKVVESAVSYVLELYESRLLHRCKQSRLSRPAAGRLDLRRMRG